MTIVLPREVLTRLVDALWHAGPREIGGVMMGELLGQNRVRIADITVQKRGGTPNSFLRSHRPASRKLDKFFRAADHDYARFNYLGEWHSHPFSDVRPSRVDIDSMREMITDETLGANFIVLLIVSLVDAKFDASALVFFPDGTIIAADLIVEEKT